MADSPSDDAGIGAVCAGVRIVPAEISLSILQVYLSFWRMEEHVAGKLTHPGGFGAKK